MRPAIPFDRDTSAPAARPSAQRARGQGTVRVKRRGADSALADLHMAGSTKLLFPRVPSGSRRVLDAVVLNSAGGVTGGDDFSLSLALDPGAVLRVTTQAAERLYRAPPDNPPGRVATQAHLGAGATLTWLPQETILYDGGALDRSLSFDMAGDARLLSCETLIFGRQAMGEQVHDLRLRDHLDLRRDGALIFADRLRLEGDAAAQLALPGVGEGAGAMASVLLAEPEAERHLEALRALLPESGGASAPVPGLVFLRVLAKDGFALRKTLVPLLEHLSGAALPRPWML